MGVDTNDTSSYLNALSDIYPQFLKQRKQVVKLAEWMIESRDLVYIPQIFSYFPLEGFRLPFLDADMRRLEIICEIVMAEVRVFEGKIFFFEGVSIFDDLMKKYVSVTLLLRRIEFHLSDKVMSETALMLRKGKISICAIRKITNCEIFTNPDFVYSRALKMLIEG